MWHYYRDTLNFLDIYRGIRQAKSVFAVMACYIVQCMQSNCCSESYTSIVLLSSWNSFLRIHVKLYWYMEGARVCTCTNGLHMQHKCCILSNCKGVPFHWGISYHRESCLTKPWWNCTPGTFSPGDLVPGGYQNPRVPYHHHNVTLLLRNWKVSWATGHQVAQRDAGCVSDLNIYPLHRSSIVRNWNNS